MSRSEVTGCPPSTQQSAAAYWTILDMLWGDVIRGCDMTPTSGCTSTIHILFLACTERIASILVPYWFSLYSPCSMNLGSKNTTFTSTGNPAHLHRNNSVSPSTYLLFKTSASNCCLVTKWYSTPSFSWGFLGLVVSVDTQDKFRCMLSHRG